MLISKTATVKWGFRYKEYYVDRGYKFTKWKDEFEVKVEDLTEYSHALIRVKCDNCDRILENIRWYNYKRYEKENKKYYCTKCSRELFGLKNINKTKLSKGKSFEGWCIENSREDLLKRWDYEKNDLKPNEVLYSSAKRKWLKCPNGIHESELKNVNSYVSGLGNVDCKACNSFAQWGCENIDKDFLLMYWNFNKNIGIDPWEVTKGCNKKVWIKCQNKEYHESYRTECTSFTAMECRCPLCTNRNGKVHVLDSLGTLFPEALDIWSSKNKKSALQYSPHSNTKVWWKCSSGKHGDYYRLIANSSKLNFRCPKCVQESTESVLQEKVRLYIESLKYTILHENQCTIVPMNPKTKTQLRFDNEIKELKLVIEVHGIQHYELNGFHSLTAIQYNTTPEYEFHMLKVRDRYKRIYAYLKGYQYLEIKYDTNDEKGTWKRLINYKIEDILSIMR